MYEERTYPEVQKFAQASLEMVFYGAFTVFGLLIVPQQEWFWPSRKWWTDVDSGEVLQITDAFKAGLDKLNPVYPCWPIA
jgi:hypothetical protein